MRKLAVSLVALALLLATTATAVASDYLDAFKAEHTGSHREYGMSWAAKMLCSGVFVAGRAPEHVINNDIIPLHQQTSSGWFGFDIDDVTIDIDYQTKTVTFSHEGEPDRTSMHNGHQGCNILPRGETGVFFEPVDVTPNVPDPALRAWPEGDVRGPVPKNVDIEAVEAVLDNLFQSSLPRGERAWVIVHRGQIIGERYADGFDERTPHFNWSTGKSMLSTILGVVAGDGHLDVKAPAPIPEWQGSGDPRSAITPENLLHMAGGLENTQPGLSTSTFWSSNNTHHFPYMEGFDIVPWATHRDLVDAPGTNYDYSNANTNNLNRILRDIVQEHYDVSHLEFPQRELFDKIGVQSSVLETDPYGFFAFSGLNMITPRDWARIGMLYLQNGKWNGEQILADDWLDFVMTPSPANPGYGAHWYLSHPASIPDDAFRASGAFGQNVMIIPSADVVVVRNSWRSQGVNFNASVAGILGAIAQTKEDCKDDGWSRYSFANQGECVSFFQRPMP